MPTELRIFLSEEGTDIERLDRLTMLFRQELLQIGVENVTARAADPPPGARPFDPVEVGGLIINLGHSVEALRNVASAIQRWLAMSKRRKVKVILNGNRVEIYATAAEQERLIEHFVSQTAMNEDERWTANGRL